MNHLSREGSAMATTIAPTRRAHYARTGAPLAPPVISYAVLTLLAVIVPATTGSAPWTSDSALLGFFTHHSAAAHASAFFLFGSSIPFAVTTAVATSRLRTLGLDVPGRIIAQIGGALAASMLAF